MTNGEGRVHDPEQLPLWHDSGDIGEPQAAGVRAVPAGAGTGPVPRECLWDIRAVSQFLGVPVATIYQWRVKGEGPRATRMGKHLRFEPEVVRAWVSEHRETA